jgi:hypothetical protein
MITREHNGQSCTYTFVQFKQDPTRWSAQWEVRDPDGNLMWIHEESGVGLWATEEDYDGILS